MSTFRTFYHDQDHSFTLYIIFQTCPNWQHFLRTIDKPSKWKKKSWKRWNCWVSAFFFFSKSIFNAVVKTTKFQTGPRWQKTNKCDGKTDIHFGNDLKHSGKRRKCWWPAFSPFPVMFSKSFMYWIVKSSDCVIKSYNDHNGIWPTVPGILKVYRLLFHIIFMGLSWSLSSLWIHTIHFFAFKQWLNQDSNGFLTHKKFTDIGPLRLACVDKFCKYINPFPNDIF